MQYTNIENTDFNISKITLGTWVFGGRSWGGANEKNCVDAVDAALDLGVNCIDTAPIYGNGLSEEIVGRAIKGKRNKFIIATKCGLKLNNGQIDYDLSYDSILEEVDASLRRLQIDHIDLYQCHAPDKNTPLEETMKAMNKLKQEGKIRAIGISNYDCADIKKIQSLTEVVSLQSHYSLLERDIETEILPYCKASKVQFFSYGALAGGLLTGKYKEEKVFDAGDARSFFYRHYAGDAYKAAMQLLKGLEKLNRPVGEVAINWVKQQQGVATVIVGARNAQQMKANAQAASWDLSSQELQDIKALVTV